MKLKGTMVLELTDEATGEVESVTEENMVTEAVNDILGMNPMGVFYSEENLMAVGERDMEDSYPERKCRCCMRNGYLYVPAYDKKGIYKINVANSADVALVAFGFTSKMKPLCESATCELYLTLIGDLIIGGDFQVTADDMVIHTQGSVRLGSAATPLFQYKQFLVGWGGSYGNEYRHMYLLTPYLATINNLSSAVVKDANKTMKITYTLTEEA